MPRPTAVTVFGAMNIGFGIMGLTCTPVSHFAMLYMPRLLERLPGADNDVAPLLDSMTHPGFTYISMALGMVASAVLLASGIGLLRLQPWARHAAMAYSMYVWVSMLVGGIVSYYLVYTPMREALTQQTGPGVASGIASGLVTGLLGTCFSLVYPTILFIFMLMPDVKAAFMPGWGTPPPLPFEVARQPYSTETGETEDRE